MHKLSRKLLGILVVSALSQTSAAFCQVSDLDALNAAKPRSLAEIDIVGDDPNVLQAGTAYNAQMQQSNNMMPTGMNGMMQSGMQMQNNSQMQNGMQMQSGMQMQNGMQMQSGMVMPMQNNMNGTMQQSTQGANVINLDPAIVTRAVGVAGAAVMLGSFMNNGGVGGMMKQVGWGDNRFHGRGPSIGGY